MTPVQATSALDAPLALAGELTVYTAAENLARLTDYLSERRQCDIDLSAVSEIDSAGVQLLLWARRVAEQRKGRLRLVGRSPAVTEVIHLLQLEPLFGGSSPIGTSGDDSL